MSKFAFFIILIMVTAGVATEEFSKSIVNAARERTLKHEVYDSTYRVIAYPMGDVPDNTGVCTDVVIRAYRKVKIDLQVLVHEDMRKNFSLYPKVWGLRKPDRNIDHRRVLNLQTFFRRAGASLPITNLASDYKAGELVTWMLPGDLPHIGIVSDKVVNGTPMIIHNIGAGTKEEDILFNYPITGHYRYIK